MKKVTIIIGSSGMLGSAILEQFKDDHLICFDCKEPTHPLTDSAVFIKGEVENPHLVEQIADYLDQHQYQVDNFIYSAATYFIGSVEQLSIENWQKSLDVNITGLFITTKMLMKYMKNNSKIIAISSQFGQIGAYESIAYSTSKAAMINFIRSLALDYGNKKILANCICPGFFDSPFFDSIITKVTRKNEWMSMNANLPRSKVDIQDIVAAIKMLSENNSMTGTCITIDGGYSAR